MADRTILAQTAAGTRTLTFLGLYTDDGQAIVARTGPRGGMVDTGDLKSLSLCGKTHTKQGVAKRSPFLGPI